MGQFLLLADILWATILDVLPIAIILFVFQIAVIRKVPANLGRILGGFVYVIIGLALFLVGLEEALFPIGRAMAEQLTDPAFLGLKDLSLAGWQDYMWIYIFGFAVGFATTVAEPALIAVSLKAEQISGGTLKAFGLRMAVALGVAVGVSLGTFRIVTGTPLHWYIMAGYVVVILQTLRASRFIIPLAYDSGGVTTSTVTVPVVTALGLGLAASVPGRSPLVDGFGLIAFASLFPMMTVMGYAQLTDWLAKRHERKTTEEDET
ncbi:DUF1538 domain-containing protein [Magnetospira thiophila]